MKKLGSTILYLTACLAILALVIVGIWPSVQKDILPYLPTAPEETFSADQSGEGQIVPKNVLQIGDSFEFYPDMAEGHFLCSVTGVRLVTEASECPPEELFYEPFSAYKNGEYTKFPYSEWFTADGAYDCGSRIVLVDLTVSNVDATAWVDNGKYAGGDCGWFKDTYAFYPYFFVSMVDMSKPAGDEEHLYFYGPECMYFSHLGQYAEEDDPVTMGVDSLAIYVEPGETVCYTLGFPIKGNQDGSVADLSKQWLVVGANSDINEGIFIDTKLGDDGAREREDL